MVNSSILCIFLNAIGPFNESWNLLKNIRNFLVSQKSCFLEIILCQFYILLIESSTAVFNCTEFTPVTCFEFTFSCKSKLCSWNEYLSSPFQTFIYRNLPSWNVVDTRLYDCHTYFFYIIKHIIFTQSSKAIKHQLLIPFSINRHTFTMLVVDNLDKITT